MNLFSISQLQQFSGIKAHTIRMWEQRYNALQPNRSEGNTRYYDNSQLRRLLNIVSLMSTNHKVSELCSMPDKDLALLMEEQLKKIMPDDESSAYYISQLMAAGTSFDEVHFEKIFSSCVLRLGLRETYTRVIYPLLNRVGLMWVTDKISPAYEHFISNIIKQKIFAAIDALPPAKPSAKCWLLFLPENEFHEIGLLLSQYLIRLSGAKVIYLGNNVPLDTLIQVKTAINPDHLLLFFVHFNEPGELTKYLDVLKKNFSKSKIHVAGNEKMLGQEKPAKGIDWIHSVEGLEELLRTQIG